MTQKVLYKCKEGATSQMIDLYLERASGGPATGVTHASFAGGAGELHSYLLEGAAARGDIPIVDATLGAWTSGGWKEVDATNLPGIYQFGIPNAVLAIGTKSAKILLRPITAVACLPILIEIDKRLVYAND